MPNRPLIPLRDVGGMSHTTTTAALLVSLASIVVALRIDVASTGEIGADFDTPTQTSTTSASIRQDPFIMQEEIAATVIHTDAEEQLRTIEWALDRYEQAGLELPVLEVHAYDHPAACGGKNGFFSATDDDEYQVHWCGNDFTILHELAHAWAEHALGEVARTAFLTIADADEWVSDDWRLCGSEHSANVIAWGLMDTRINQTRTRPYDHASMLEAYSALTGGGEPLWTNE